MRTDEEVVAEIENLIEIQIQPSVAMHGGVVTLHSFKEGVATMTLDDFSDAIALKPTMIKIDVDGIEHLILSGAGEYLKDKKIKSISVEINENFNKQFQEVVNIMHKNNFVFIDKKQNDELKNSNGPFSKSFNYIFNKK